MKSVLTLLACLTLAACGGGGSGDVSTPVQPTEIRFIGNSLTVHKPLPEQGWYGNWGMAASAQDKDYAHLTAHALNLPLEVFHVAQIEIDPSTADDFIPTATAGLKPTSIVVIQLGDNLKAESLPEFTPVYGKLLDAAKGHKLLCLSTWWGIPATDDLIKKQCAAHGGTYVYIGDIKTDPSNPDGLEQQFKGSTAVDSHPHDWSMARIAERTASSAR